MLEIYYEILGLISTLLVFKLSSYGVNYDTIISKFIKKNEVQFVFL